MWSEMGESKRNSVERLAADMCNLFPLLEITNERRDSNSNAVARAFLLSEVKSSTSQNFEAYKQHNRF